MQPSPTTSSMPSYAARSRGSLLRISASVLLSTRFFTPHFRFRLIEQDPDDNKFVDCAIVAGADYIVSEDAHFRVLETIPFPKVNVIRLNRFMEELAGL